MGFYKKKNRENSNYKNLKKKTIQIEKDQIKCEKLGFKKIRKRLKKLMEFKRINENDKYNLFRMGYLILMYQRPQSKKHKRESCGNTCPPRIIHE